MNTIRCCGNCTGWITEEEGPAKGKCRYSGAQRPSNHEFCQYYERKHAKVVQFTRPGFRDREELKRLVCARIDASQICILITDPDEMNQDKHPDIFVNCDTSQKFDRRVLKGILQEAVEAIAMIAPVKVDR